MSYTLWRGDQLLGHIRVVFPSTDPELINGLLYPADVDVVFEPLMQVRLDFLPGTPTYQHGLETKNKNGSYPLRKLDPSEVGGVDATARIALRTEEGEVIETRLLLIEAFHPIPTEGEVVDACGALNLPIGKWMVSARLVTA